MKSRVFRFYILSACGACMLTGVFAAAMTGWMLRPEGNTTMSRQLPVAWAMGGDRCDSIITCSGPVEGSLEAVYVLDMNTGMLTANVLAKTLDGIQAKFGANVTNDLGAFLKPRTTSTSKKDKDAVAPPKIDMPQSPRYVMTTAMHDASGGSGNTRPAQAALCVTEVNTGIMLVYVIPWNRQMHAQNTPAQAPLALRCVNRVITPQVEEQELK